MVEHLFMVRWVIRSIPRGGLIELYLIPMLRDWNDKGHGNGGSKFPFSRHLSGPLPYDKHHITINNIHRVN